MARRIRASMISADEAPAEERDAIPTHMTPRPPRLPRGVVDRVQSSTGRPLRPRGWRRVARIAAVSLRSWFVGDAPRSGAAIAYYSAVALGPLLAVTIGLAGTLFGRSDVERAIMQQATAFMGDTGGVAVREILERMRALARTDGIIGGVMLLFASTGAFVELQGALARILTRHAESPDDEVRAFLRGRLRALGAVFVVSVLLLATQLTSTLLASTELTSSAGPATWAPVRSVISTVAGLAISSLLFALLFRSVPGNEARSHELVIGGVITSMLFALGQRALTAYLGHDGAGTGLGTVGVVLVWLYYSAQIVLLGAECTRVLRDERMSPELADIDRDHAPSVPEESA
jgi:membrane protein